MLVCKDDSIYPENACHCASCAENELNVVVKEGEISLVSHPHAAEARRGGLLHMQIRKRER